MTRSGRRRYLRTILLGVAALLALLWAAVEQFGLGGGWFGNDRL